MAEPVPQPLPSTRNAFWTAARLVASSWLVPAGCHNQCNGRLCDGGVHVCIDLQSHAACQRAEQGHVDRRRVHLGLCKPVRVEAQCR